MRSSRKDEHRIAGREFDRFLAADQTDRPVDHRVKNKRRDWRNGHARAFANLRVAPGPSLKVHVRQKGRQVSHWKAPEICIVTFSRPGL